MRSLICTPQQILAHSGKQIKELGAAHSTFARKEVHTGYCWRNLVERDHLEGSAVEGRIIFK
jgi:hypothetical protein